MTARCVHVEFQLKCLGKTLFEIVINFEFGITQMGKYLQMGVHKTRNTKHSEDAGTSPENEKIKVIFMKKKIN